MNKYKKAIELVKSYYSSTGGDESSEEIKSLEEVSNIYIVLEEELYRLQQNCHKMIAKYNSDDPALANHYRGRADAIRDILDYWDEEFIKEWDLNGKALAITNKAEQSD